MSFVLQFVSEECAEGGYVLSLNGAKFRILYYKQFLGKRCRFQKNS